LARILANSTDNFVFVRRSNASRGRELQEEVRLGIETNTGIEVAVISQFKRATRDWFARDAAALARDLLGCRLVRVQPDGTRLSGMIVECEAYLGVHDRASHAYAGRRTERNAAMYADPATAYVYFTYGMHYCVNAVCGKVDEPVAVLLRALEPVEGLEIMRELRSKSRARRRETALKDRDLCSGPGKLCQAMAIDRKLNGADLASGDLLFIERPLRRSGKLEVVNTTRVGIDFAGEWKDQLLRWYVKGNEHVSVKG